MQCRKQKRRRSKALEAANEILRKYDCRAVGIGRRLLRRCEGKVEGWAKTRRHLNFAPESRLERGAVTRIRPNPVPANTRIAFIHSRRMGLAACLMFIIAAA